MPSFHQNDLFRALVATGEVELRVIFARGLTPDRSNLGWATDVEGFASSYLSRLNPVGDAMRRAMAQRDRIHLVNGIWQEVGFMAALAILTVTRARYAIYSEAQNPFRPRSRTKMRVQSVLGRIVGRRASGWFPVARLGAASFAMLGAVRDAIYPFGYFRAAPLPLSDGAGDEMQELQILFVGQVIGRKGVDLLLDALFPLFGRYGHFQLRVVGDGEMTGELRARALDAGVGDRVIFSGVVSSADILSVIAHSDLLVLPSRWDGWGMVVNEALSVGVPAVVSSSCGAADLIENGVNGFVFKSENVENLRACLDTLLRDPDTLAACKRGAADTGRMLSVDVAAPYLVNCLKHMIGDLPERPVPPWSRLTDDLEA